MLASPAGLGRFDRIVAAVVSVLLGWRRWLLRASNVGGGQGNSELLILEASTRSHGGEVRIERRYYSATLVSTASCILPQQTKLGWAEVKRNGWLAGWWSWDVVELVCELVCELVGGGGGRNQ